MQTARFERHFSLFIAKGLGSAAMADDAHDGAPPRRRSTAAASSGPSEEFDATPKAPGYFPDPVSSPGRGDQPRPSRTQLHHLKHEQERMFTAPIFRRPSAFAQQISKGMRSSAYPRPGSAPVGSLATGKKSAPKSASLVKGKQVPKNVKEGYTGVLGARLDAASKGGSRRISNTSTSLNAAVGYSSQPGATAKRPKTKAKNTKTKRPFDKELATVGRIRAPSGHDTGVPASLRELDNVFKELVLKVKQLENSVHTMT